MSLFSKFVATGVFVVTVISINTPGGDAFLSGAPGPRSKVSTPITPKGKPQVDVESRPVLDETVESSTFNCDVIYVGDTPVRGKSTAGLCFDSDLTDTQARAIALEAATSKTVPKATVLEALHCLALTSQRQLSDGGAPASLEALEGVWRLCFCDGDFIPGMEIDRHGYINREQQIDVRFDALDQEIVLGSTGLASTLPRVVTGGLAFSSETQTVTGTFNEESTAMDALVLQAFLVDEDALGFHVVSKNHSGFVLFHAEKGDSIAARVDETPDEADLADEEMVAEKAATVRVAGQAKVDRPIDFKVIGEELEHEKKRVAVEEKGRRTGSFNSFVHYLETEGASIYAVLAGPVIFSFLKHYNPVASSKATAAAVVFGESLRHYFEVNT